MRTYARIFAFRDRLSRRRRVILAAAGVVAVPVLSGCAGDDPGAAADESSETLYTSEQVTDLQAISLLGDSLTRTMLDSGPWPLQDSLLAEARAALQRSPDDPGALVWVGRRLGYLGRYDEAIAAFGTGMERFPDDPRFPRHRGHRLITVRDFHGAVSDLSSALEMVRDRPDQVEPDGLPNAKGIPVSTLHSNIRYHLGLAHYLLGDWEAAGAAFGADVEASVNPDMQVASSYWLYLILRRSGDESGARALLETIDPGMEIIENTAYHRLLLLFKGHLSEADLLGTEGGVTLQGTTVAYGVGAWRLLEGDSVGGMQIFRDIVAGRSQWPAFGYVAAEAELARARE
jgi:tetratricopeptide (TPR) repeat protein